jgi:hypothetical protein
MKNFLQLSFVFPHCIFPASANCEIRTSEVARDTIPSLIRGVLPRATLIKTQAGMPVLL